jgi:CheY-like chemotaxis protein
VTARILVVEDDPQNLYLVKYLLEKSGHEVVVARDGEEGVAMAKETQPDLVLMDMLLPKMDGYAATRAIKDDDAIGETNVVALTAYSMKGDRARVMEAGCAGYIPKPLDPSSFVSEISKYLECDES